MADLEIAPRPPFQMYFDYKSSKLNPTGVKTVSDAATALPKEGTWRYELIGHADRSGSDAYNMKLSRARAEAVRTALVIARVARSRIDVNAHGERHIPVATTDNVKQAKNRVVEGYGQVPGVTQTSSR